MGAARNGFFNRVKTSFVQVLNSSRQTTIQYAGFFSAFLCDSLDFCLTLSKSSSNRTADIFLGIIPSACFLFATIFSCCSPGVRERQESVGSAALSFFNSASYLLSRSILDLSLALWVRDYSVGGADTTKEYAIINGAEIGIELVCLAYMYFERRMREYLDICLSEDAEMLAINPAP